MPPSFFWGIQKALRKLLEVGNFTVLVMRTIVCTILTVCHIPWLRSGPLLVTRPIPLYFICSSKRPLRKAKTIHVLSRWPPAKKRIPSGSKVLKSNSATSLTTRVPRNKSELCNVPEIKTYSVLSLYVVSVQRMSQENTWRKDNPHVAYARACTHTCTHTKGVWRVKPSKVCE